MDKEPTNIQVVLVLSQKDKLVDEQGGFVDVDPYQPEERSEVEDSTDGVEPANEEIAMLKEELPSMVSSEQNCRLRISW